jgi:acyl dehydratase
MPLDADLLYDRRRLKRRLSLWRGLAVLAAAVALIALLIRGADPTGLLPGGAHVARLDVEAAKASGFGQILVNSTFTFSLLVGLSVGETTLGTLVANLGFDKVVTPKPVFIGDTLRASSEVKELRESKSRPDAGIVTWVHEMHNQRDEVVCRCERSALIQRKI